MDYKNKYFKYKKKYNNLKLTIEQRGGVNVNDLVKITDSNKKTCDQVKGLKIYKGNVIKPGQIYFSFNYGIKNKKINLEKGVEILNFIKIKEKQAEEAKNQALKQADEALEQAKLAEETLKQAKEAQAKEAQAKQAEQKYERANSEYTRAREAYIRAHEAYTPADDEYDKTLIDYILKFEINDGNNIIDEKNLKIDHLTTLPIFRKIALELMKNNKEDEKIANFLLKYLKKNTTYYLNNDIIINVTLNENANEELKKEIIKIIEK